MDDDCSKESCSSGPFLLLMLLLEAKVFEISSGNRLRRWSVLPHVKHALGDEGGGGSGDLVSKRLDELLQKVPENFSTIGIQLKAEKLLTTVESPYTLVVIQETGRMNVVK